GGRSRSKESHSRRAAKRGLDCRLVADDRMPCYRDSGEGKIQFSPWRPGWDGLLSRSPLREERPTASEAGGRQSRFLGRSNMADSAEKGMINVSPQTRFV